MTNYEVVGIMIHLLADYYDDVDITTFSGVGNNDYFKYTLSRIRFKTDHETFYLDVRGYSPFKGFKTFSSCEVLRFFGDSQHESLLKLHLSDYSNDKEFIHDLLTKIKDVVS